jgi:hypothetical protein
MLLIKPPRSRPVCLHSEGEIRPHYLQQIAILYLTSYHKGSEWLPFRFIVFPAKVLFRDERYVIWVFIYLIYSGSLEMQRKLMLLICAVMLGMVFG